VVLPHHQEQQTGRTFMTDDIFEIRRQARGPRNYLLLWLAISVLYAGWQQGWPLMAGLLCGPCLAMVLVRLAVNEAEGFRMTAEGIDVWDARSTRSADWASVRWVMVSADAAGRARCVVRLADGGEPALPAASALGPDRLAEEFQKRGVTVRRGHQASGGLAPA
jgi:hypothetical protein